jgi:GT2 family glycosyltransferase
VGAVEVLSGCFWMVRREALNQVGLLDENFSCMQKILIGANDFGNAGWKVVYFPDVQIIHYGAPAHLMRPSDFIWKCNGLIYNIGKNTIAGRRCWFLAISLLHHAIQIIRGIALYLLRPGKASHEAKDTKKRCLGGMALTYS